MKLILMSFEDLEMDIERCQQKDHIQQVAFSTYHHALTQICFTCDKVRTSMDKKDLMKAIKQKREDV